MRGIAVWGLCLAACTFSSVGGSGGADVGDTEGPSGTATMGVGSGADATTSAVSGAASTGAGPTSGGVDPSTATEGTTEGPGGTDTGQPSKWCIDADGDGAGDPETCMESPPDDGWVDNADDCDDGDPLVAQCPATCMGLGGNLSCSRDFESFTDENAVPACPTSDLTHDVPAGPLEWAIRTADAVNSQWPGHGITDHTSGSGSGRVFYGDLGPATPGVAYWRETLDVTADTGYVFQVWLKDTATNDAGAVSPVVDIVINGVPLLSDVALPALDGDPVTYTRVSVGWSSGAATTATLEIINKLDGAAYGYDIAIDDVLFAVCG